MAVQGQITLLALCAALVASVWASPVFYHSEREDSHFRAFINHLEQTKARDQSWGYGQQAKERPHLEGDSISEGKEKFIQMLAETSLRNLNNLTCEACKVVVGVIRLVAEVGLPGDRLEDTIIHLCDTVSPFIHGIDSRVCSGAVHLFKDEVWYIMDHLGLSPHQVCGLVFGSRCADGQWPLPPWNVSLPDTPKPPVVPRVLPKPGSPTLRVLHLTDIHLDLLYTPDTDANCHEPLCCRSYDGKPEPGQDGAGHYGDYRNCDTPMWTLEGLFSHLSQQQYDYIMWTGDLPAHNVWNQSRTDQTGLLYNLTAMLNMYFPHTPIFPAVGNHESSPVNSFPPRFVTGSQSIQWLYDALARAWSSWLPEEALESVRRGGYYTVSPFPGFRIISLNTNACHEWNWWLFLNTTDPDGQLAWLIDTLLMAETNKEKVHIMGHIPPGIDDCLKYWSYNYYLIVDRFESTISGQFFGHTHKDHFEVFYDTATLTRPTSVAYISPSVTPFSQLNMGYRVFTVDGNYSTSSYEVVDHETFILNLTSANSLAVPPVWQREYSARGTLGMGALFPSDWHRLVQRAGEDNSLLQMLYRFYYKSNVAGPCDADCAQSLLCACRSARSYSQQDFCPHVSPSLFANHPLFRKMC
ncbi:sphingomyelin phosphodiesterase-like isoform X2 [Babylonia areolata]|uniref:sphingomyelin phosphodiesterase-like isoform X2 n=1 Tax=Babylonia areolata TaxID=304850 RepID=UPI003FCF2B05